ncbi:MAG TPA: hypothetical protein VFM98_01760 [Ramlibacter sp.]|uniref:hypothetical protein n=1 Tax=Ramlibacter sp. TaxID=1917967 RepID=UPI002D7FB73B|nr:hypothetical protein [Ramlibacter sp.]HET8744301.1 hypothetical protein [Ramlibacter sp.]
MRAGFERIGRTVSLERAKRSCLDKRAYKSRNEARDFAARNRKKYGETADQPYRCTICGKFHLATRKAKRKTRAKAGRGKGGKR